MPRQLRAYKGKVVPDPAIKFASLGEYGNCYSPGNEDSEGLDPMKDVLCSLVVLRECRHGLG